MGAAGSRFGRNVPLEDAYHRDVLEPNPRTVSQEFLTHDVFLPTAHRQPPLPPRSSSRYTTGFSHGANEVEDPWKVGLNGDDRFPDHPMVIRRTHTRTRIPTPPARPPTATPRATGGTRRRSMAAASRSRKCCAPTAADTSNCQRGAEVSPLETAQDAARRRPRPRQCDQQLVARVGDAPHPVLSASTTGSAIISAGGAPVLERRAAVRHGAASSTQPSSRRSTRSSGRPRCSPTPTHRSASG